MHILIAPSFNITINFIWNNSVKFYLRTDMTIFFYGRIDFIPLLAEEVWTMIICIIEFRHGYHQLSFIFELSKLSVLSYTTAYDDLSCNDRINRASN